MPNHDHTQPATNTPELTNSEEVVIVEKDVGAPCFAQIKQWLVEGVARLMMMPHSAIDTGRDLEELGLDSMEALEIIGALSDLLGRQLSQTLVADYGSIDAIAHYLSEETSHEKPR